MLGAIIGDIVGSRFEFSKPPKETFELFTDECNFTDDTICTIAIADAILHGRDYQESLLDWCRRYPEPMGSYGTGFSVWLQNSNPQPYDSCGNGSAMRVSSVGWLFEDFDEVLDEAKKSAEITHNHPEGIKGAQCIAASIFRLRTCQLVKESLERHVEKRFGYEIPSLSDVYRIGATGHFDATCQETVPMAIRCFVESVDFEDALRLSVLAGGDTDTKTDITGALAEAYYEIPEEIASRACAYLPEEMIAVLHEFYEKVEQNINL